MNVKLLDCDILGYFKHSVVSDHDQCDKDCNTSINVIIGLNHVVIMSNCITTIFNIKIIIVLLCWAILPFNRFVGIRDITDPVIRHGPIHIIRVEIGQLGYGADREHGKPVLLTRSNTFAYERMTQLDWKWKMTF